MLSLKSDKLQLKTISIFRHGFILTKAPFFISKSAKQEIVNNISRYDWGFGII